MSQKLFCCDLDGTLLTKEKKVPPSVISSIKKLTQAGHMFSFVTGRSFNEIKDIYEELELSTPIIADNGARMFHPKDPSFVPNQHSMTNVMFYKLWNNNLLQDEVEYFIIKTDHGYYINRIPTSPRVISRFEQIFHINLTKSKDVKKDVLIKSIDRKAGMLSIILIIKKGHALDNVVREIKSVTHNISITRWSINNADSSSKFTNQTILELNNRSANKLAAIMTLQDYYDIPDANVHYFGDGENDVPVLKHYANSIAVKNACYSALINAHHISKFTNEEGAVGKEIDNILDWEV